ncbi:ribonuclease H-like domain-containing protein [Paenibacillus chitinolyticus]|uniref:ribonuclease H-like domain-containing protein n=1 Tax=Paenibacillus chitinolyticus TaxID=79263 RepID=UPI0035D9BB16
MSGLRDRLARHLKPGKTAAAPEAGAEQRQAELTPEQAQHGPAEGGGPAACPLSESAAGAVAGTTREPAGAPDAAGNAPAEGSAPAEGAHGYAGHASGGSPADARSGSGQADEPAASAAPAAPAPAHPEAAAWAKLDAELYEFPAGSFVRRVRTYPMDAYHGRYRLDALHEHVREFGAFHPEAEPVHAEGLLFFDTETTGLGVGAGNVAFLVGIGYYETGRFVVEQLFIRHPAEERAMLAYLEEKMKRFTHVVSYNGRTFDWPILQNRFILNRMRPDIDRLLHLDLLHPSRSLWKHSMPSVRLGKVEEAQLGYAREDDVSGAFAPELYVLYLAEGKTDVLRGVFVHNERDIVSLAALSALITRYLADEEPLEPKSPGDLFRLGQWLLKMNRLPSAEKILELGFYRLQEQGEKGHTVSGDLLLRYAAYYKKAGVRDRAVELWNRLIRQAGPAAAAPVEAYIELAMHYEHGCKDYALALELSREALDVLRQRRRLLRRSEKAADEERRIAHRIERLQRKLRDCGKSVSERKASVKAAIPSRPPKPPGQARSAKPSGKPRPAYAADSLFDVARNPG